MVDAAGGAGIPVRVDHSVESEVAALAERIRRDHGQLDVLANVLGGPEVHDRRPFLELSLDDGRKMLDGWIWPHVVTARHALPLMVDGGGGLFVEVIEGETLGYGGQLFFDLAVTVLKRLAYVVAEELAEKGVAALALAPGFMRTEAVLDHLKATEENWREVARKSEAARQFGFAGSESPCFVGRAVAALVADPDRRRFSGGVHSSWELAEVYGFTDVDGGSPRWGSYFAENFPQYASAKPRTGRRWSVERV